MPPPSALLWSGVDLEPAGVLIVRVGLAVTRCSTLFWSRFRACCVYSEGWVLPPLGALLCAGLDLELAVLIVRVGSCRH